MPSRRLTLPAVAALALACIALGVLAALADGSGATTQPRPPRAVAAVPAAPARAARAVSAVRAVPRAVVAARRAERLRAAVPTDVPRAVAAGRLRRYVAATRAVPVVPDDHYVRTFGVACGILRLAGPVGAQAPRPEPVPDDLLHAFGILRRAATPDDALPKEALQALRRRGLEPFDPAAARLVRTTADGGKAWVVPTRDVPDTTPCAATLLAPPAVAYDPTPAEPVPAPAPPRSAAPRAATRPTRYKPHPGLALVSLGGAPVGAGGRYEDLIRGREEVATDPCGGPGHDMLSVSGLVPDGVPAAFLTSPDGTAIRADVRDNAYTFVVPRPTRPESRYVVWTGGDGTPHVQPLSPAVYPPTAACTRIRKVTPRIPEVSPSAGTPALPAPVAVRPLPAPKRHK